MSARYKIVCFALVPLLAVIAFCLYAWFGPRRDLYDASNVFTPCIRVPADAEHWAQPNCRGVSRLGDRQAEMSFNSAGLRDRDYPPKAAKGTYRILVIGSSNTLGPGMNELKTFPRQLEQVLQLRKKKQVQVINGAMVGYCTIQSSFKLKELLSLYSPDLVLYQWVQGACPLFDGAWNGRVLYEDGQPRRIDRAPLGAGKWQALNNFVFRHSSLFFLWLTAADQWRKAVFSWFYSKPDLRSERVVRYMEPSVKFLSFMKETSKNSGAQFRIVSYQMKPFTQSVPTYMVRWLARLLSVLVKPIDFSHQEMFSVLEKNGLELIYYPEPTKDLLIPGDVHLGEEGIQRLALATAESLEAVISLPSLPRLKMDKDRGRGSKH